MVTMVYVVDTQTYSPKVTRNAICEALRSDLLSGKLDFDQPIREQKLAERFGTSRGPVRDALLRLTQEGALVYEANKGVRVISPLSDEERCVVASMRLSLEKHCLAKFMQNMNKDDSHQLTFLLERLTSACERASLPGVAECDLALHRYWVAQASSHLETMWLGLSVRMIMKYSRLTKYEDIAVEHQRIVEAILLQDMDKALFYLGENVI
jgi:GntR family transcriptional regulator, rspAB operon transcriptional repressor